MQEHGLQASRRGAGMVFRLPHSAPALRQPETISLAMRWIDVFPIGAVFGGVGEVDDD